MNANLVSTPHSALHPRYARQIVLREFGVAGQEKLVRARVLIVGVGGLGSPAAMYLAAAGVGTIGLIDSDVVDESNLHRQLLYGMHDVGANKLDAAAKKLAEINPLVHVVLHRTKLSTQNARAIATDYDIVLDGTDNFPARYAINDACVALDIPFVYGSVARFEGQVSVFAAPRATWPDAPCYRCLFPSMPAEGTVPSCAEDGVLGVLPGIIGLHQSTEVIKCITGLGRPLVGRLLMLDLLDHSTNEIEIVRDADCPVCGVAMEARDTSTFNVQQSTGDGVRTSPTPSNAPAYAMHSAPEIDVTTVDARLKAGHQLVLLDVREQWEYDIAHLPYATLVPLSTLPDALPGLDSEKEYVVYCHHGMRSAMAANWLVAQGFQRVSNMIGGIDAWSVVIDGSVAQY